MTTLHDYLKDADEQMEAIAETSSEPIQATSEAAATEKCQDLANKY